MIAPRLSDDQLRRAGAVVGARCGLRFDAGNRPLLEEGLVRAAAAENATPEALVDRLERAPSDALLQSVLRQVTIGETYFFRHPEHFEALRTLVLPERTQARGALKQLRGWSAGCATGEEAWSLLMALQAAGADWQVSVLGTDINKAALAHARAGRYGRWSVRAELTGPAGMVRRLPDGGAEVAPWLHAKVRFDYLNLHDPIYPSLYTCTQGLDVIFCRNVLVYFMPDAAAKVLARLADCLCAGGWLVVGALDVDLAPPELERVRAAGVTILRKPAAEAARPVRTTPARPWPAPPPPAPAEGDTGPRLLERARAAADRGALDDAIALGRQALACARTPAALHLVALLLGERGEEDERLALLHEVIAREPDDALALLALGMSERTAAATRAGHLGRVLALTARRLDGERLPGPEPLPVAWVRKVASAALRRLEEAKS